MNIEKLTRDVFLNHLGDMFEVYFAEKGLFKMSLTEVSDIKKDSGQESFSIVFLAPADTPTDPLIYQVAHEKLGQFEIFLSPFWQGDEGIKFESIFSRVC